MRDSHFREVNVASLHVNPVEQENRPAILKNHLGTGEAGCAAGGSAAGYTYTESKISGCGELGKWG